MNWGSRAAETSCGLANAQLHTMLVDFYNTYYVGPRMRVVIVGSEHVTDLEDM